MIFKYNGYGYRLAQHDQNRIYYKVKKLKWHWYKRCEILGYGYEPIRWGEIKREDDEVTEEFIRRTHEHAQAKIDTFVARDEELRKMKEMLHEPNLEFINRVMK